jgi:hypothetical protein
VHGLFPSLEFIYVYLETLLAKHKSTNTETVVILRRKNKLHKFDSERTTVGCGADLFYVIQFKSDTRPQTNTVSCVWGSYELHVRRIRY